MNIFSVNIQKHSNDIIFKQINHLYSWLNRLKNKNNNDQNLKSSSCFTYNSNKGKCYNRGDKIPLTIQFYQDEYVGKTVVMVVTLKCYNCNKKNQGSYSLQTPEPVQKGEKYGINLIVPNEAEFSDKYYLRIETSDSGLNVCSGESVGDYFTVSEEKCSGTILNMIMILSVLLLIVIWYFVVINKYFILVLFP